MAEKKQWHEMLHDQFGQYFAVDNVLYHEKTDHQDLIIFENAAFGRVMALDGVVQTTERDEFIYHEMMTHVPLLAHGHAKHVLIIGGGDGAMASISLIKPARPLMSLSPTAPILSVPAKAFSLRHFMKAANVA